MDFHSAAGAIFGSRESHGYGANRLCGRRKSEVPARFLAWTLIVWLASLAGTSGAESDSNADWVEPFMVASQSSPTATDETLRELSLAERHCIRNPSLIDEQTLALYFEDDLWIFEDFLAGEQWHGHERYTIRPRCIGAASTLRFVLTLQSGESFEFALEALDGEPLDIGVFASGDSSFRINFLEWGDHGELLALDADFEADVGDDFAAGRIIWNTTWDPEEPPFIALTADEFEIAIPGQARISIRCAARVPGGVAQGRCETELSDLAEVTMLGLDADDLQKSLLAGSRAISLSLTDVSTTPKTPPGETKTPPGETAPPPTIGHVGTRVDSISYTQTPAKSPAAARRTIQREVAQLSASQSPKESVATQPMFGPFGTAIAGVWFTPSVSAGGDASARREVVPAPLHSWQVFVPIEPDGEPDGRPDFEPELIADTQPPTSGPTRVADSPIQQEHPQRARLSNDEPARQATVIWTLPIGRGAPSPGETLAAEADGPIALEVLLQESLQAAATTLVDWLARIRAFWLEVSS